MVTCLDDIGSAEESVSTQAVQRFEGLCNARHGNFQALLQCMRSVGEIACMQCSAQDEDTVDRACKIAQDLPESLGPAGWIGTSIF